MLPVEQERAPDKIPILRLAKAYNQKPRKKELAPIIPPATLEGELYRIILVVVGSIAETYRDIAKEYELPPAITADRTPSQMAAIMDRLFRRADETLIYQTEKLGRWVTRVGQWHGQKTISAVKSAVGVDIEPFMRLSQIATPLNESIQANVSLIRGLTARARARAENIIWQGFVQRKPRSWVAAELAKALKITKKHAAFIARDQTEKLNASLTQIRNQQLGIERYRWITRRDDKVRPLHRRRHGKVFSWDRPPSDGHPGQPINCFPGSTELDLTNGCNKLWRRFYSGPLVSVETGKGGFLEATPNHPILTTRGWLPINGVQEGDYLVKRIGNGVVVGKSDVSNRVSRFDNFFHAAQVAHGVKSTPGSEFDFHGDGAKHNVDQVNVNGDLAFCVRVVCGNGREKLCLSGAGHDPLFAVFNGFRAIKLLLSMLAAWRVSASLMSFCGKLLSFFGRHFRHADVVSTGASANGNATGYKNAAYGRPLDAIGKRKRKFTLSSLVLGANLLLRKVLPIPDRLMPVHGRVKFRAVSADCIGEIVARAAKEGRGFFDAHSARYEFDRVVKKTGREFSGHVFNISNDAQWYLASGFIVHNCRCVAQAILDYDEDDDG